MGYWRFPWRIALPDMALLEREGKLLLLAPWRER